MQPAKEATPDAAAFGFAVQVNVPLGLPVPDVIASVMLAELVVTTLPSASSTLTFGCVAHAVPPVPPLGCCVNTSCVAVPAVTLKVPLTALVRPADAAVLRQTLWIDDFSQRVTDFNDTAALIDAMELIITVDTSIAHLAGAMGKPVWLLACFNADWRWPRDDDRSTWYPTMRIFHQRAIGDWPELVTRVEAALAEWIAPLASTADL